MPRPERGPWIETLRRYSRSLFVRGTARLYVGGGLARVLALGLHLLLARRLGPEAYGSYVLVVSLAALLPLVLDPGVRRAILARYSRLQGEGHESERAAVLGFGVTASFAAAAVTLALGLPLLPAASRFFYGDPGLGLLAWVLCGAALLQVPNVVLLAALEATGEMTWVARLEVIAEAVRLLAVGAALWAGAALGGVVAAMLAASAFQGVLALAVWRRILAREGQRRLPRFASVGRSLGLASLRRDLRLGLLLSLPKRLDQLGKSAVFLLLGWLASESDVGYLRVGMAIGTFPLWLTSAVSRNLLPTLGRYRARGEYQRFKKAFLAVSLGCGAAMIPLAALLALVAPPLVTALYGADYRPSLPLVDLFLLFTILSSFNVGHDAVYLVDARVRTLNLRAALQLTLALGLSFPLIRSLGAVGAGWVLLVGLAVTVMFDLAYVWRRLEPSGDGR